MNIFSKLKLKLFCDKNIIQSRDISSKLHDSHVKYASEKINGTEIIIAREGHLNVVEKIYFEYTVGVRSVFKFKIDEMKIWEFMSLDGAVITGYEYNDCKDRTVTVYYDRHLT